MSEPVFFPPAVRTSLADIVACTGAAVIESADLSAIISSVAPLDEAGPGELTFLDSPENVELLERSRATACFVTPGDASRVPKATFALVMKSPIAASRSPCKGCSRRRYGQNPCWVRRDSIRVPQSIPKHGLNKA